MCGIAGIFSKNKDHFNNISHMVSMLKDRGPDSINFWKTDFYSAGMTRLSINDIEGGSQPLFDQEGKIILFYNGEIYNYRKIRAKLELEGFKFKTNSDGEVISHLYKKYNHNCFKYLDGMFAIAIWDDNKKELILARDFPGEKPLYYSILKNGGIVFSSEIQSILKSGIVDRSIDHQALWDFPTFLWIPEPATIYKNIRSLMPGEIIKVSQKGIKSFNFKKDLTIPKIDKHNEEDLIYLVKETVEKSIISRLLSDVPIGSFLSGGLDSSIVCSIANKYIPDLQTFCIGFENVFDPYHGYSNESKFAEEYAKLIGTKHTTIEVNSKDFKLLLPKFITATGQPYAVSSGLGVMKVAEEAKNRGLKVLLTGDGADEAFGGYSWYNSVIDSFDAEPIVSLPERFVDGDDDSEIKLKKMSGFNARTKAWSWHYYASEVEKSEIFNKDFKMESSLRHFVNEKLNSPIDYIHNDQDFYFPNEMLSKADKMTMAFSVEGRPPLASSAVQGLARNLDINFLIRNKTLKWVLKKAFEDIIPKEILYRPKHGFSVPIDHWLKSDWKELFANTFSEDSLMFKKGYISKKSIQSAKEILYDPKKVSGHVIFSYITLEMWLQRYES